MLQCIYFTFMSITDAIDCVYYALRTLVVLIMIVGVIMLVFGAYNG
jgi:hypothetical protein